MSVRAALLVLCFGAFACHAPTLWVGTALSSDSGAASGAAGAGDGLSGEQPAAAGTGGVGGHIGEALGGNVPAGVPDAGLRPMDAGRARDTAPASTQSSARAQDQDDDADAGVAAPEVLAPSTLPSIEGACPEVNGPGTYMFSGGGRSLMTNIYMRPDAKSSPAPGGPLIFYFHSLGGSPSEVTKALGQPMIDTVVAQGGVVASFWASTCLRCGLADDVVWYDEDDAVSDQVLACVTQKAQIDPRRIHAVGFSAGALHAMHLALARSSYIASVVSYSGGRPSGSLEPQDPANKVPALLAYGQEGVDNALVDFNIASREWFNIFSPRGYYVLLCNHGRDHEIATEVTPHILRFLLDHPYRVDPEPYRLALPQGLPSYCSNGPP